MLSMMCTGNLGRDADLRTTGNGKPVAAFPLAVTIGHGQYKEVQWVQCSLFGKRGESLAPYLKKGAMVTVSGGGKLEHFTRRDGTPGAALKLVISDLDLHPSKLPASQPATSPTPSRPPQSRPQPEPQPTVMDFDDEIPF